MEKLTTQEFVNMLIGVHGGKYDYSLVKFDKISKKIKIICPKHGEFLQVAGDHRRGKGCRECAGKMPLNTQTFIKKSKKIHKNEYNYSLVDYKNVYTKVKIICPIHGVFEKIPLNFLKGYGCRECQGKRKNFLDTKSFIKESVKIHGDKYNYSESVYINYKTNIKIICPIHGLFEQTPANHLAGRDCKQCSLASRYLTKEEFVNRSQRIHGNKYDYSGTNYEKNNIKVKIRCLEHGIFLQMPYSHCSGQGCPNCKRVSKGEQKILEFLKKHTIKFKKEKTFDKCRNPKTGRKLRFDFYLPDYNLLIEYDGKQHFFSEDSFRGPCDFEEIVYRDNIKNQFCKNNNIPLLRIPYKKFKNINNILSNVLQI